MVTNLYKLDRELQIDRNNFNYSKMKLGCPEAMEKCSEDLAQRIGKEIPHLINKPSSWVLVYPGTNPMEIPNSIHYISGIVSDKLGLMKVELTKDDGLTDSKYDSATIKQRNMRKITLPKNAIETVIGKKIVLLDDCITCGRTIEQSHSALTPYTSNVKTYVFYDLRNKQNPGLESDLNTISIEKDKKSLAHLWNDELGYTTTKLISYSFRDGAIKEFYENLSDCGAVNLYLAALLYFKQRIPDGFERLTVLLEDRGLKEGKGFGLKSISDIFTLLSGFPRFRIPEEKIRKLE